MIRLARFVGRFEGFVSCPYRDPVGIWTIGYGFTKNVGPWTPCMSKRQARKRLKRELREYRNGVRRLTARKLRRRELHALTSFAYNVGLGAYENSTLRRRLNQGDPKPRVFRQELPKWVKGGGRTLPGLVTRRAAEVRLATTGRYSK